MRSYVRINLALPKELGEWIQQQAAIENRSVNNYVKTILLAYRASLKEMMVCTSQR